MAELLPNATTPGEVDAPWYDEPAKKIAAVLSKISALITLLLAAVLAVTDLIPGKARGWLVGAVAVAGTVLVGLQRVQAVLTRDRVYSPTYLREHFGDPEYPGGGNTDYPEIPKHDPAGPGNIEA